MSPRNPWRPWGLADRLLLAFGLAGVLFIGGAGVYVGLGGLQ